MVIKGRCGTGGSALARYLVSGKNDHAEVLELRNLAPQSVKSAMYQMDALARGSRCEKHALHVQFRAAPGERLSADQWLEAADRYAEAFGLQDHQALIVLHHQEDGTTHCHAVFNRVNPDTLKAADMWQNYKKHKALARQMEQDWGLQIVSSEKSSQAPDYSEAGRGEIEQGRRKGQSARDVHKARATIQQAWERSDSAESFAAALQAVGLTLQKGDRRDFVAVDAEGSFYGIGKRTTGATADEVRARMKGFDPERWNAAHPMPVAPPAASGRGRHTPDVERHKQDAIASALQAAAQAASPPAATTAPRPTATAAGPSYAEQHKALKREHERQLEALQEAQEQQRQALAQSHERERAHLAARSPGLLQKLTGAAKRIERENQATLKQIEAEAKAQAAAHEKAREAMRRDYDAKAAVLRQEERAQAIARAPVRKPERDKSKKPASPPAPKKPDRGPELER